MIKYGVVQCNLSTFAGIDVFTCRLYKFEMNEQGKVLRLYVLPFNSSAASYGPKFAHSAKEWTEIENRLFQVADAKAMDQFNLRDNFDEIAEVVFELWKAAAEEEFYDSNEALLVARQTLLEII